MSFHVPHDVAGTVNARFRIISASEYVDRTTDPTYGDPNWTLGVNDIAYSGEVEDHQFDVIGLDYGDADVDSTRWTDNGARHLLDPAYLATHPVLQDPNDPLFLDSETDGQRTTGADADDLTGDDENGVSFIGYLMPGENATIVVSVANAGGWLDGWIDFNNDGNFQTTEYLFGVQGDPNLYLNAGTTTNLTVPIPQTAVVGNVAARFRISTGGQPVAGRTRYEW